jgi:tRNA A37 threonylcarbamoyladenosine synthetase subunit TsaC/SUA5/YrdC
MAQLGDRVDLILDGGPARGGVPSTVVDCTGEEPKVLRIGAIAAEAIVDALEAPSQTAAEGQSAEPPV